MNYIVNPHTNIKYSIFSKKGIEVLKSYVKFYQTGGANIGLETNVCNQCEKNYTETNKLNDSNINKCLSAKTTLESCGSCAGLKLKTFKEKTKKEQTEEETQIGKLLDKGEEMKAYREKKCNKSSEEDGDNTTTAVAVAEEGYKTYPTTAVAEEIEGGVTKDDESLTSEHCETGWKIKGDIGQTSQYANVYETCCAGDCTYASKIIGKKMSKTEIFEEIKIHKAIYEADNSLTISIVDVFEKPDEIILVLPKLIMTVGSYLEDILLNDISQDDTSYLKEFKEYVNKLYNILRKLHDAGFQHGDAHLNNFMINSKDEIKLIDFGKSLRLSKNEQEAITQKKKDSDDLYESLVHSITYSTSDDENDIKYNQLMNIVNP
jgi:tRNA A-37 threonylcarbamoyl transferase component Bud32